MQNTLAKRILSRRSELGMTQEALAALIGADYKKIWRYENGENKPSAEVLAQIAEALNTTPNWLLGFDDKSDLRSDERLMLDLFRSKDDEHRRQLLDIAKVI